MTSSSLSFFLLLIIAIHESQCKTLWEKFRTNYWERKDALTCYRDVTLQLFENLKEVVEKVYVEVGEKDFKSKVIPRSKFSSFFNKEDNPNGNVASLKKKIEEAETAAYQAIFTIRRSLSFHCTDEKQEKVMEFTKIFKEGRAKCGDAAPNYLSDSIMRLEQTCPEKGKEGIANDKPTYTWKSGIHDPWAGI